jgi:hypothetical protein
MAKSTHYDICLQELINSQPIDIKIAYQSNNSHLLKKYIGESEFVANPTDVAYLSYK